MANPHGISRWEMPTPSQNVFDHIDDVLDDRSEAPPELTVNRNPVPSINESSQQYFDEDPESENVPLLKRDQEGVEDLSVFPPFFPPLYFSFNLQLANQACAFIC